MAISKALRIPTLFNIPLSKGFRQKACMKYRKDVEVTRRLFELGRDRGYLIYRDHSDRRVRVPVAW